MSGRRVLWELDGGERLEAGGAVGSKMHAKLNRMNACWANEGAAVRTRDWLKGCIETPRGPFPSSRGGRLLINNYDGN